MPPAAPVPAVQPGSSPRQRLLPRLILATGLVAAVVAAIWWATRPKPIPVILKDIDRGRVESTLSNTRAGTVEACQRTRLSTILGGRIEKLAVKEGDKVKKGQLLLKLWNDDQQAQSSLAAAQLESARRRVGEICTLAGNARREADRTSKLRRDGFVSISREESARAEADAKQASCDTTRSDIDQAAARLKVTQVEMGRTSLVAPFDGTVAKIVGELGEYTTPSPPGVATPPAIDLIDDSCLYVKAPMDETDAPKIRAGQVARVTLDAFQKRVFAATVRRVAPVVSAVEKQARTVDIEVAFDRPDDASGLLVGYSADVEIVLEQRPATLRVPTGALQEGGRVLVFVVASGKLEERRLKTGVANWEYTEVLEGIAEGERVVTSLERDGVKAGARVVPEEGKSPATKN
jgi:HlyD family secretion protein